MYLFSLNILCRIAICYIVKKPLCSQGAAISPSSPSFFLGAVHWNCGSVQPLRIMCHQGEGPV